MHLPLEHNELTKECKSFIRIYLRRTKVNVQAIDAQVFSRIQVSQTLRCLLKLSQTSLHKHSRAGSGVGLAAMAARPV